MRPPSGVIAFLTDFGARDPYVACMKGVALSINPSARLVDVTHEVPSFDVWSGAFNLLAAYKYFPEGTVFVGVVDPGVGSERRAVLIVSRRYYFIGPDNGLLLPAALDDGVEAVYALEAEEYRLHPVSRSFHGRDVFTPAAAWLTRGVAPSSFGRRLGVSELVGPPFEVSFEVSDSVARLTVIHVDKFGNIVLSARFGELASKLGLVEGSVVEVRVEGGSSARARVLPVFSLAGRGELVLYEDSFGFAELAVNLGSAAELLRARRGARVELKPLTS